MKIAYLEYALGAEGAVRSIRVLVRSEIAAPSADLIRWLDWAEPGEAYQDRNFLYLCVQLTRGE